MSFTRTAGLYESYRLRASCRHDRDDGRKEDREDSLAGLVNNHDEQEEVWSDFGLELL